MKFNTKLIDAFIENANVFDKLMMEMLTENSRLKEENTQLRWRENNLKEQLRAYESNQ